MAKDLLVENYHQQAEIERVNWDAIRNMAEQKGENFEDFKTNLSFPSEKEVIKKAKIFNNFIFG
jgi:hypothetical protein